MRGFLIGLILGPILIGAPNTAGLFFWIISFGRIRVQGTLLTLKRQPEFSWHNVIWKWDSKYLWLSEAFALYCGLFFWFAAMTAVIYYWRSLD